MQLEALVANFNKLSREQLDFAANGNFLHLFSAAKTGCEALLTLTVEMRRELLGGLSKSHALIAANLPAIQTVLADEAAYQAQFIPGLARLVHASGLEAAPAAGLLTAAGAARALIDLELVDFSSTVQTLHTLQNMACFIYQELDVQEADPQRVARLRLRLERITAGYGGIVLMGLNANPPAPELALPAALSGVLGVSQVHRAAADMIA